MASWRDRDRLERPSPRGVHEEMDSGGQDSVTLLPVWDFLRPKSLTVGAVGMGAVAGGEPLCTCQSSWSTVGMPAPVSAPGLGAQAAWASSLPQSRGREGTGTGTSGGY